MCKLLSQLKIVVLNVKGLSDKDKKKLPNGRFAAFPQSLHVGGVIGPSFGVLDDQLKLLRLQIGDELRIAEPFVVTHVAVDP